MWNDLKGRRFYWFQLCGIAAENGGMKRIDHRKVAIVGEVFTRDSRSDETLTDEEWEEIHGVNPIGTGVWRDGFEVMA